MAYREDELLMLSGIQHYYFCNRQWALIHIEQQWAENEFTIEGQILHKKADNPLIHEKRKNVFISRAMNVASKEIGLYGVLDVVEFKQSKTGIPIENKKGLWEPAIVEYKRGKIKKDNRDIIQLVAQVICLEETLSCQIEVSYLYYHSANKKIQVVITEELRELVVKMAEEMHDYYDRKEIPRAEYFKNCRLCSLYDICMPRLSKKPRDIDNYINSSTSGEGDDFL